MAFTWLKWNMCCDIRFRPRSVGRPVAVGLTPAGRGVLVVYDWLDDVTVYPITAYEVE
jgi:hypothetical protein